MRFLNKLHDLFVIKLKWVEFSTQLHIYEDICLCWWRIYPCQWCKNMSNKKIKLNLNIILRMELMYGLFFQKKNNIPYGNIENFFVLWSHFFLCSYWWYNVALYWFLYSATSVFHSIGLQPRNESDGGEVSQSKRASECTHCGDVSWI